LQRSNTDWIRGLCGAEGADAQRLAHEDLANYLYVVAYNYLRLRQDSLPSLTAFAPEELAALAQDFVQETLEKLARNQFALLDQFRREGRFTSWAAQIIRNQAAMELRRPYWTRRLDLPHEQEEGDRLTAAAPRTPAAAATKADPEHAAQRAQVTSIVEACLEHLPARCRLAIVGCIAEESRAESVAQTLNTTANAIYLLIARGKRQLRECLQRAGLTREVLRLFDAA
jgi:RNA polymerase sigma-70 factor (ECF subfamily)